MSAVIENPEQAKYAQLWHGDHSALYRAVAPGTQLVDLFLSKATVRSHHTIVDFGVGTGRAALQLARRTGARVIGIDFVDNCMDADVSESGLVEFRQADLTEPLRFERPADYGFCTDVLEHIPPDDVDAVLANVVSSARRVFFCISTVDDVMGSLIGESLHLTVQPAGWWREKLESMLDCRVLYQQVLPNVALFYVTGFATYDDHNLVGKLNVEEQLFRDNIRSNLSLGLREVVPHATQDAEVMLLCGGPSLNDYTEQIAADARAGVPIVTVNGTYNWAVDRGLVPGLQVMVDARDFNRRFVEPDVPSCQYAVSSQCAHSLVASLPRDRTLLWHGSGDEVYEVVKAWDAERGMAREYYPIPGGSSVSLRALPLLAMLGFRRISVYGLDSCYRAGAHHAYPQSENDEDQTVHISVDGRDFYGAPWMIQQAHEFQPVVRHILAPLGVELAVHGDGLIAAIINAAAAAQE